MNLTEAKYNAYFALASTATRVIRRPRALLIDDCVVSMTKKVDWVEKRENRPLRNPEKIVETDKLLEFNLFDGCGAVSPEFAASVAGELGLDYIPSGLCVRCAYIKGMTFVADFKAFAKEYGVETARDLYGKVHRIEDIDVILTKSMFKLWNAYDDMDDYDNKCALNGYDWGVARVAPKRDGDYFRTNYQFCQALKLTESDIEELCRPTIEWLNRVGGGDAVYALLYLTGGAKHSDPRKALELTEDVIAKALRLNPRVIEDEYVRRTILYSINKKIKEAYVGKLITRGAFSLMIPDMAAFMQWAMGLRVTGALKEFEHYSQYWNARGVSKAAAMRSPLTWRSEINSLNFVNNDLTEKWFKYLTGGVVYNVFGADCMLSADSDFDGDLVAVTDNPVFLNRSLGGVPIAYEKQTAPKREIQEDALYKADILAFDSPIGQITNRSTTWYDMLAKYEGVPGFERYEKEIIERLKLARKYQGNAIDKAKGIKFEPMPKFWNQKTSPEAANEDAEYVAFINELTSERPPYFFRYLYKTQDDKYKKFIKDKNAYCETTFGKGLSELLKANRAELSADETEFTEEYYKYAPLIDCGGEMNRICRYMEDNLRELTVSYRYKTPKDVIALMQSKNFKPNAEKLKLMEGLYEKYRTARSEIKNYDREEEYGTISAYAERLKSLALESVSPSPTELADLAVELCYKKNPGALQSFAWKVFGEEIIENVKNNSGGAIFTPVESANGDIEYLGKRYELIRGALIDVCV